MTVVQRVGAVFGFLAVSLGAFGAHKLQPQLEANETLAIWNTAAFYHLVHAVVTVAAGRLSALAGWLWVGGITVFSGSLYILALTNIRWLGAITPVGGILLLAGWACLAFCRGPAGRS